ncbi:MAG: hypothetical protein IPM82_28620, partial [Saprospiraceae bacterium]|nr:hypothetical protein [Saprospiraceae bacterium]
KNKIPPMVYAAALDNIFCAMKGHRLFDRFGFNLPKKEKAEKPNAQILEQYEKWLFDAAVNDWVNQETGEVLTGFTPSPKLKFILASNVIDTDTS